MRDLVHLRYLRGGIGPPGDQNNLVRVNETVRVPPELYACAGVTPLAVVLSPKSKMYWSGWPFSAVNFEPSKPRFENTDSSLAFTTNDRHSAAVPPTEITAPREKLHRTARLTMKHSRNRVLRRSRHSSRINLLG